MARGPAPTTISCPWRRKFILAELFCGLVWAAFALVGIGDAGRAAPSLVFSSHVFIFASLIVLLAVRMTLPRPMMSLLYVGTIPMTIAVSARLIMLHEPFYYALATMAVGVHLYFVFLAKGVQQTTLQMLAFRAQKDILIAELDEERLVSDEARRRAEAGSKAKSRFLATMSHELRTPLNAIMGFSEVMKDEMFGQHSSPIYREYSKDVYDSGSHLLQLINEILDLSRIEAGRYELVEERAHLGDIVQDCQRLLMLRATGEGLHVHLTVAPDLPQVWIDVRAIRQICLNLLSNAIKFTPKGGSLTIVVSPTQEGGQMLSVRDTGPGIPADEIPKVMQAFGQGSLAHETAEGGTGLGLPIVKSLTELHGGSFELTSELRKGTEVRVMLPRNGCWQPSPRCSRWVPSATVSRHHPPRAANRTCGPAPRIEPLRPHVLRASPSPWPCRFCRGIMPLRRQPRLTKFPPWPHLRDRTPPGRMMGSPCIKVCVIDPAHGLCEGCGRSRHEIARWSSYTDSERRSIMQELKTRAPTKGRAVPGAT